MSGGHSQFVCEGLITALPPGFTQAGTAPRTGASGHAMALSAPHPRVALPLDTSCLDILKTEGYQPEQFKMIPS